MNLSVLINRLFAWILKHFYKYLYHQFAKYYDFVSVVASGGLWKTWVSESKQFLTGPNVLEIGHGPGHLLCQLNQLTNIQAIGLDESWQMTTLARNKLDMYNFPISLVNGVAQSLPFRDSIFDQIVATFPSDYIYNEDTLLDIHRVLLHGGELIIIPVAWITSNNLKYLLPSIVFSISMQSPIDIESYSKLWRDILDRSAFQAQIKFLELQSSRLMVIIAKKA